MKLFRTVIASAILPIILLSCNRQAPTPEKDWRAEFESILPLLGHRNWVAITDMAYPLQSGEGIITLYADEPYTDVLKQTLDMIDKAPHVFPHIYHDTELDKITEEMVPGIEAFKRSILDICGDRETKQKHEDIIHRLDEAGELYTVVVIKTPLTTAYSSTFLELDCAYWSAELEAAISE